MSLGIVDKVTPSLNLIYTLDYKTNNLLKKNKAWDTLK